ncbi:AIPR family protein [Bradyrhizobium sp. 2S1]|uniref:AIPR family protein n=1 Tax=Bradyrhizobium sp. 2S1 TaxID=1404429 RepID=UPI00140E2D05|nr:AIPR family protein [Bradyrhizobium sp. 2S1]MCK7665054.1 AIPR family protein [Bradyrhizobium sp. 2S1]
MSLNVAQRGLLETVLRSDYVPNLPPLLKPKTPQDDAVKNLSRALAAFAVSALCDVSPKEAADAVVDDYDDLGLDGVYYHGPSETLYLVQGKLKAGSMFSQDEANAFVQGIRKLIAQDFSGFNAHILKRQTAIEGAIESCSTIELVVVHVGAGLSHHAGMALQQLLDDDTHGEQRFAPTVIDFDSARIVAQLQQGQAYPRVDGAIVLKAPGYRSEGRKTYIGFAAIIDLVKLHQTHGKALYAKNIRQHLGLSSDANKAIRNTLGTKPEEFEYLNNGVTILADRIDPKDNHKKAGKRLRLTGMSIINGAQTVGSSASFVGDNPTVDISSAVVHATIIQADNDVDFSKKVTRARNLQNQVVSQNFAALDDQQERLRCELGVLGFQYVYKPEGFEGTADPKRISIEEAAQALAMVQADPRFPVYLKKEPGQLLLVEGTPYRALFTSDLTAYRLANAVLFSRYVNARMVVEAAGKSAGPEKLAYKHGTFALGFVLAKSLEGVMAGASIIEVAKLESQLSIPFDGARQSFWDAMQKRTPYKGPLAILRNLGDALPVLKDTMMAHYGLGADPAIAPLQAKVTAGEPYPQKALFDFLSAKAPQIRDIT